MFPVTRIGFILGMDGCNRGFDVFQGKIILAGVGLFRLAAKGCLPECRYELFQTFDPVFLVPDQGVLACEQNILFMELGFLLAKRLIALGNPGLRCQDHGLQRFNVIGKIALAQHGKRLPYYGQCRRQKLLPESP